MLTFEPFKSLEQRFPEWLTVRDCMVVPEQQGFFFDIRKEPREVPTASLQMDYNWLGDWVGLAPQEYAPQARSLVLRALNASVEVTGEDFFLQFVAGQPATQFGLDRIRDAYQRLEYERQAKGEPTARQALLHVLGVEHCFLCSPHPESRMFRQGERWTPP